MWTPNQRKALLLLCMLLALFLAAEAYRKPAIVADPPSPDAPRSAEIENRIDPNTADVDSLASIPNLGEKKAAEIVAYRDLYHQSNPDQPAFRSTDDFLQLKGFGAATVANLSPYLVFGKASK